MDKVSYCKTLPHKFEKEYHLAIPSDDEADLASHRGEFRSAVGVVILLRSLKNFAHCAASSARVDDACTGLW
jgi:hypothetical protein